MWWSLLLLLAAATAYIFRDFLAAAAASAWTGLLTTYGFGLAILGAWLIALALVFATRRFKLLAKRWNRWLAAAFFSAAAFGLLAFFETPEGILKEASLGGLAGTAIIGAVGPVGVLRWLALFVAGMFCITPKRTAMALWKAARAVLLAVQYSLRYSYESAAWLVRKTKTLAQKRKTTAPAEAPGIEAATASQYSETAGYPETLPSPFPAPEMKPAAPATAIQPAADQPSAEAPPRPKDGKAKPESAEALAPLPSSGRWQLPPVKLLENPPQVEFVQADVDRRARLIEDALASYGVEAKVVQTNVGPTVTQFGVEPGWDHKYKEVKEKDKNGNPQVRQEETSRTRVKVDRIASLANDLALALAAPSIRIEAPVPGKPIVGVEVPNSIMGMATLRSVIESQAFSKTRSKAKLTVALGKAAGGEAVCADLSKMPHLLIAGATGSGKTVCLNTVICSLLMFNTPDDVHFLMVDPKRVEMVSFNSVPHLISPVVVDSEKAVAILKWLNQEMDSRYRKLAAVGARNIETYHRESKDGARTMPYLVLVIDELADLMMSKAEEVEPAICRLAQLARATGIHMVVATQRPSVDVITGLIKANFPTRISFAVASQIDSRTILDSPGAEKLLGRGDMLFLPPESPKPRRLQGCFVSDQEIDRIVRFWSQQRDQKFLLTDQMMEELTAKHNKEEGDPLLEEARQLSRDHSQISTSFLQRRLRIGYPRAARLTEILQEEMKRSRPKDPALAPPPAPPAPTTDTLDSEDAEDKS